LRINSESKSFKILATKNKIGFTFVEIMEQLYGINVMITVISMYASLGNYLTSSFAGS